MGHSTSGLPSAARDLHRIHADDTAGTGDRAFGGVLPGCHGQNPVRSGASSAIYNARALRCILEVVRTLHAGIEDRLRDISGGRCSDAGGR